MPTFGPFPQTGGSTGSAASLASAAFAQAASLASSFSTTAGKAIAGLAGVQYSPSTTTPPSRPSVDTFVPAGPAVPTDSISIEPFSAQFDSLLEELGAEDLEISHTDMPTSNAVFPVLNIPAMPEFSVGDFTDEMEQLNDVPLRDAPDYALPSPPEISENDIRIPSPPSIDSIAFEGTKPVDDLMEPRGVFIYNEERYRSDLLDASIEYLVDQVKNGGTGLSPEVEQAIITRAKAKQQLQNEKLFSDNDRYYTVRNHALPPGAHAAGVRQILIEIKRSEELLANEVMIKSFELAQANTQFSVEKALQLEKDLLGYANQVAERSFASAKFTASFALDVFNAKVQKYVAKWEGYKAEAAAFESRVRAELSKVEVFKAQIEGARLTAEVKQLLVNVYRERVGAVQSLIDLYKAELQGAALKQEMEFKKLEEFRARVDAYTAQVNAQSAKYNAYATAVAGEGERAKIYKTQVDAYATEVQAASTKVQANVAEADSKARMLAAKSDVIRSAVAKYSAMVESYKAKAGVAISNGQLSAAIFDSNVKSYAAEVDARASMASAKARVDTGYMAAFIEAAKANATNAVEAAKVAATASSGAASAAAQLAAGAMTSVNASAVLGSNESVSEVSSWNSSNNFSASFSNDMTAGEVRTTHIITESV